MFTGWAEGVIPLEEYTQLKFTGIRFPNRNKP